MTITQETNPLNQTLLTDAWRLFSLYEFSANAAQKRFIFFRKLILTLSVTATTLAVGKSVFDPYLKTLDRIPENLELIQYFLYYTVILAPIIVSILLAGAVKFDRGVNWLLLRASAEMIKQEIYCYRTQVGIYRHQESRDTNFAQAIQTINEHLMSTQVNRAGLVLKSTTIPKKYVRETIQHSISDQDSDPFSVLTPEEYLQKRLLDQLSWYRRKASILDRQWQFLQWLIYIFGGLGAFLAAIEREVWIAVSNGLAAALANFLELKQLDITLIGYNQAAFHLENVLCWWHALTPEGKKTLKNFETLVEKTEQIIHIETSGWVQEMRDALTRFPKEEKEEKKLPSNEATEQAKVRFP